MRSDAAEDVGLPTRHRWLATRLSAMYFLQFAVFGAQTILLGGHIDALGFSGTQISYVFATGAIAALISPLLVGVMADRYFATQIIAGCCYLGCAPLLALAWTQTSFAPLWLTLCAFALVHLPTFALTNVVAFHHLPDARRLGHIRVWGTIGWVAISWLLAGYLRLREGSGSSVSHLGDGLLIAAGLAVLTGVYCLSLPDTPPGGHTRPRLADGLRLLRHWPFAVLLGCCCLVAMTRPFFYNFTFIFFTDPDALALAPSAASGFMSVGQVAEIGVMLGLAASLRRLGMRLTVALGITAQAVRFGVLSLGEPAALVIASQALHGFAFTFISIGSIIAVERLAPPALRASAQGFMVLVTGGIGALAGHYFAGQVYDAFTTPGGAHAWPWIFLVPGLVSVVALVAFVTLFRYDPA